MGTVTSIDEARVKREHWVAFERGDHVELAARLVESLASSGPAGATPAVYSDGHVWKYDEQEHIYRPIDPRVLRRMVHQYAGATVLSGKNSKLRINAGSGVITVAQDQLYQEDYFADAPIGLTFANGFLTVTEGEAKLVGHSPAHKARFRYPFDYNQEAMPNRFLQFLAQVFRDDTDAADKIKLLQEYVGASMFGLSTKYQRMLILLGQGSNGKSVFQQIAESAMPAGSVCAIAPQAFGQEYRRAMLAGKLLNIVSELPAADILDSENFKAIIAGDPITARQIFKEPFTFRPIAGHLCSANRLPVSTDDQSHGFWRRMIVLGFNRSFGPSEQNPTLADELIREELSAIVSWFIGGAQRVQLQGGYTIPVSHQAALDQWRHDADPVRSFVEQKCDCVPAGSEAPIIPSRLIYAAYRRWCLENGHRPLAINRFGQRMSDLGIGPEHKMNGSYYPVGLRA